MAFARGSEERDLQIVVDERYLDPADPAVRLLAEFAEHDLINMVAWRGGTRQPGILQNQMVVADDAGDDQDMLVLDVDGTGDRACRCGIPFYGQGRALVADLAAERGADPNKLLRELLPAQATVAWLGDVLVTGSSQLLKPRGLRCRVAEVQHANPMPPAEALAIMGLFLRSRRDYVHSIDGGVRLTSSTEGQYRCVVRAALPEGWRIYSATRDGGSATGDETYSQLAETIHLRVERALHARDAIMAELQRPCRVGASFELLYHLDVFLVQLIGSADALARIVNEATGVGFLPEKVGWSRTDWRDAIVKAEPSFGPLLSGAGPGAALTLAATLRNNIHGDVFRASKLDDADPGKVRIVLPYKDYSAISTGVARLGGMRLWGVNIPSTGGEATIDVAIFMEELLPATVDALNSLMLVTPVERLAGVTATNIQTGPDPNHPLYGADAALRWRRLFGLP